MTRKLISLGEYLLHRLRSCSALAESQHRDWVPDLTLRTLPRMTRQRFYLWRKYKLALKGAPHLPNLLASGLRRR